MRISERHVWGRAIEIDLARAQARLYINDELIRRSFHPAGTDYQPPEVNSGSSLPNWLDDQIANAQPSLLACNALHTNFVRGNGFVILDGRLVGKPTGTMPLDGERHQPLDGTFTALVISPPGARVLRLNIREGSLLERPDYSLAISGPRIVFQGRNTTNEVPVRLPAQGQTVGDEINFSPNDAVGRASFTALGINTARRLMAVSIFAGARRGTKGRQNLVVFQPAPGDGLTLSETADLMVLLGADEAILGGGSGDTQQYIQGQGTWCALPRPQAKRVQAGGRLRGLGAILAIYDGSPQNDLTGQV